MKDFQRGVTWARTQAETAAARLRASIRERSRGALFAAIGLGGMVGLLILIAAAISVFAGLPAVPNADALWAHNRPAGVTFLDAKGETLAVRGPSHGRRVTLADLPAHVPDAFLAIEDQRFYQHGGVDQQALARAAAANFSAGETVQGGSTITQQLVKNLFLTPERTLRRKLQEIALARRLEDKLTKHEILELYLNRVYLGENAYGVDAAARRYFRKSARDLTLEEAAMLAGLPKAPSSLAPTQYFDRAKARQKLVLEAMADVGKLEPAEAQAAFERPIQVFPREGEPYGLGYVFDAALEEAQRLQIALPPDAVIRLTIDKELQAAAQQAVLKGLGARATAKNPLQAALVAVDREGAVRAMIGGTNYAQSNFNRALQARRQPGSAFKLFVFAAAMEAGLTPDSVRFDEPIDIEGWSPENFYEGYRGAVTLRTAFALSLNTVAASLANEIGRERVVEIAERLGLSAQMDPVPSIALGTTSATPMEMTQAYAVFMREGRRAPSHLIAAVADSRGETAYAYQAQPGAVIVEPQVVRAMNNMLGKVVRSGTGTVARLDRDVAGKTGTSQQSRDAWFVGYTADLTAGVWVGHDNDKPTRGVTGGTIPAQIWASFMREAVEGTPPAPLPGIEDEPPSPRRQELAAFYRTLKDVFARIGPLTANTPATQQPAELVR